MRFFQAFIVALLLCWPAQAQQAIIGNGLFGDAKTIGGGGGGRTCTDGTHAAAFNARLTGSPSNTLQDAYCNFINGLDTDGLFSSADAVYILATNTATNAALNLISTSYSLTVNGSPTFSANSGYAGAASAWLATGFNASTAGGNYAEHSASSFLWTLTNYSGGTDYGAGLGLNATSGTVEIYPHYSDNNYYYAAQASSGNNIASKGHFYGWVSTTSIASVGYVDATGTGGPSTNAALANDTMNILSDFNGSSKRYTSSSANISFAWFGGILTGTQEGNLCHRVYTFMNTIAGASGATC